MRLRSALLLACLAAPAAAQLLLPEPELPPGAAAKWSQAQSAIDADLKAARWNRAVAGAQKLLDEMVAKIAHGRGTESLFARAALARGLARAGLGQIPEAVWDVWEARALDPEAAKVDFAAWGETGRLLAAKIGEDDDLAAKAAHACTDSDCEGISPPAPKESHDPVFPRGSVRRCSSGLYQASAVVGGDGWLHRPTLDEAQDPVLAFVLLETLRRNRYQPAMAGGQPVAVRQQFEIHFHFPSCEGFGVR